MNVGSWDFTEFGVTDTPLAAVLSRLDSRNTYHIDADRPGYPSLFEEALDLIGPLKLGQCYGFFPALALGGSEKIENVQIVDAKVHFNLLAQMGPLRIEQMTERNQLEFIRYAGPQ